MTAPAPRRRHTIVADIAAMVEHHASLEAKSTYLEERAGDSGAPWSLFERLARGHTVRPTADRPFSRAEMRLAEINRLIEHRHGGRIPKTDDPRDGYVFAVAVTVHAEFDDESDRRTFLLNWLSRAAAWIIDRESLVNDLLATMHPRRKHLKDRRVGELVNLKASERDLLGIRTMSPADMTPLQFAKARKEAKRRADRERDERKRRARGAKPQKASAAQMQPWKDAGFNCRRTWERWKAKAAPVATSSHACEPVDVATSSPLVDSRTGCEEVATEVALAPSISPSLPELIASSGGGASRPTGGSAPSLPFASMQSRTFIDDTRQTAGGIPAGQCPDSDEPTRRET